MLIIVLYLQRGIVRQTGAEIMANSLSITKEFALSLAQSLMVTIVVFNIDGHYGAMPEAEYDGPSSAIIQELDPFELGLAH